MQAQPQFIQAQPEFMQPQVQLVHPQPQFIQQQAELRPIFFNQPNSTNVQFVLPNQVPQGFQVHVQNQVPPQAHFALQAQMQFELQRRVAQQQKQQAQLQYLNYHMFLQQQQLAAAAMATAQLYQQTNPQCQFFEPKNIENDIMPHPQAKLIETKTRKN
jgi:hypothetical protein